MNDYRNKQNELLKEARELHNKAEADKRDLSADEQEKFDSVMEQANKYGEQAAKLEELEKAEKYMAESAGRISKPTIDLPKETKQRYSLMRAIALKAEGKELDGLEAEVSQEIARQTGKSPNGFYCHLTMPLPLEIYDTDTTTGSGTIEDLVSQNDFVKTLRNQLVVQSMGAQLMTGLKGNFGIPVQSGSATGSWVAEGVAASESSVEASSQVALSPNTLSVNAEYSKKFMRQTSIDAENFVRNDLASALALSIDAAALNGDGTGATPLGILQTAGVTLVEMDSTNGAVPTWEKIVEMETAVANGNADFGSLGYVTNSKVRGKLKSTEKATNTAQFIYGDGQFPVNGYKVGITNNMPSNGTKGTGTALSSMIYGNFSDLLLGFWNSLDVVIDPFSRAKNGLIVVTISQECDIAIRRNASFSRCTDIVTA